MPLIKEEKVSSILWGLVNGKTQTHLGWGYRPEHLPYTKPRQHDLFKNGNSLYDEKEILLIKELDGVK